MGKQVKFGNKEKRIAKLAVETLKIQLLIATGIVKKLYSNLVR